MNQHVLVTDQLIIDAVQRGDIEGDVYSDGECYVNFSSASKWLNEQPVSVLEQSAGIEA